MSAVTPLNLDRLSPVERARMGLEVLRTYARVRVVMRDDDAERAVARLRGDVRGPAMTFAAGQELVAAWRLARIVRRVLSVLPSDSRCLFRSLTLMCMLERRGIPQALVVAVRTQPFAAHAWVEVEGTAVLPAGDPDYKRLLDL